MGLLGRGLIAFAVFVAVWFMAFLAALVLVAPDGAEWLASALGLLSGLAAGAWVWLALGTVRGGIMATAGLWALIGGGIGFGAGFFGPMLLAPSANQGPLLGILFTGPLGFVGGGLAGLVRGLRGDRTGPR